MPLSPAVACFTIAMAAQEMPCQCTAVYNHYGDQMVSTFTL